MRVDGHTAVAAVMLGIFAAMTWTATTYSNTAAMVPLTVGVPALLLSAWQLGAALMGYDRGLPPRIVGAREARDVGIETVPRDVRELPASMRDELAMVLWLALFTAAIVGAGFPVGGTVAVATFLRWRLGEPFRVVVTGAVLAYLMLHLVFERMLGLVLFEGIL